MRDYLLFALLFLSLILVSAQLGNIENQIQQGEEDLENKVNNVRQGVNVIANNQARQEYLQQEWTKVLNKTSTGKILVKISDSIKKINPFFKIVLGVEYSLSWQFFFAGIRRPDGG